MFKTNVGTTDSNVRLIAGLVLMALGALFTTGILQYVLMVAGLVALITSAVRFCPMYVLLGKNTCEMEKK